MTYKYLCFWNIAIDRVGNGAPALNYMIKQQNPPTLSEVTNERILTLFEANSDIHICIYFLNHTFVISITGDRRLGLWYVYKIDNRFELR